MRVLLHFLVTTLAAAETTCHPEALDIGRHSNCPSDHWQDVIAPALAGPVVAPAAGELVMLNIGANKGFNLAEFLQRYTATNLTNSRWHRLMMRSASPPCSLQCCGVCIICRRPKIQQRAAARAVRLHAFELQPSNQKLLQQLTALTGAPIEVHGVAMSNTTGSVYTRDAGKPGYESVAAQRTWSKRAIERKVTTVDAFMAERSISRVHLVSIDTEGWDALVLRGMVGALRAKSVDVVEFEYMCAASRHPAPTMVSARVVVSPPLPLPTPRSVLALAHSSPRPASYLAYVGPANLSPPPALPAPIQACMEDHRGTVLASRHPGLDALVGIHLLLARQQGAARAGKWRVLARRVPSQDRPSMVQPRVLAPCRRRRCFPSDGLNVTCEQLAGVCGCACAWWWGLRSRPSAFRCIARLARGPSAAGSQRGHTDTHPAREAGADVARAGSSEAREARAATPRARAPHAHRATQAELQRPRTKPSPYIARNTCICHRRPGLRPGPGGPGDPSRASARRRPLALRPRAAMRDAIGDGGWSGVGERSTAALHPLSRLGLSHS